MMRVIIHKTSSKTTSVSVHYSDRMAEMYQSIKENNKVFFAGYSYRFDKLSAKDPVLSFSRCDVDGCKARIHMKACDVVQERGEHLSHATNLPEIEAAKAVH